MSKAKDRAKERYWLEPSNIETQEKYAAYVEGYHQAEKDLELTWEDISNIEECLSDVEEEITVGQHKGWGLKEMYQEALKRFKELKK